MDRSSCGFQLPANDCPLSLLSFADLPIQNFEIALNAVWWPHTNTHRSLLLQRGFLPYFFGYPLRWTCSLFATVSMYSKWETEARVSRSGVDFHFPSDYRWASSGETNSRTYIQRRSTTTIGAMVLSLLAYTRKHKTRRLSVLFAQRSTAHGVRCME